MTEGSEVDFDTLLKARAVSKTKYDINKVVGSSEPLAVKGLTVKAHAFTASARFAIEELGGKCVELSHTTHKPLGEESEASTE
jgi:ribosomal protein L15